MTNESDLNFAEFQRRMASSCNNAAWDLIEKEELTPDDALDLLTQAAAARHHWHVIGNDSQKAHADLLFVWATAKSGGSGVSIMLANRTVTYFEEKGGTWERAFAHSAMAAAGAAMGDAKMLARHHAIASKLGSELSGLDAETFAAAFRSVPTPSQFS